MPRKQGTSELFTLIHSLTAEEKGYFKKFATRHSADGNKYLQLFDAINKQTAFEEKSLLKKFKAYPSMKVYLKEMITDSLLLFYRQRHPHIDLLSQIQKVHVLLMKGMHDEALKILDKAIKQAQQMELFEQSRYLLRVQMNIKKEVLGNSVVIAEIAKEYTARIKVQENFENDLFKWEQLSFETLATLKGTDIFKTSPKAVEIKTLQQTKTSTQKSDIIKRASLFRLYRVELNQQEMFAAAEKYLDAVKHFKQTADSSYNDIEAISSYLVVLGDYNMFKELIELCDKLLQQSRYSQSHYQQLFVRCIIAKSGALVHLGRFEEDLYCLQQNEVAFYAAADFNHDLVKQTVFAARKLLSLFLNKKYHDAWLAIQEFQRKAVSKNFVISYADLKMLEIMTQLMLGNFNLIKSMAVRTQKQFAKLNIHSFTYEALLFFFILANSENYKAEAKKILGELNSYYASKKKFHRKAFGVLRYTYWLEEISGGRTMQKSLQEQFGGK